MCTAWECGAGGARLCWDVRAPRRSPGSAASAGRSGGLSPCAGTRSAVQQPAAFARRVREVSCCSAFAAAADAARPAVLRGPEKAPAAKVEAVGYGPRVRLAGAAKVQAPRTPGRQRPALTGHFKKTSRGLAWPRAARARAAGGTERARQKNLCMFRPVARRLTSASAAAGRLSATPLRGIALCVKLVPADARLATCGLKMSTWQKWDRSGTSFLAGRFWGANPSG